MVGVISLSSYVAVTQVPLTPATQRLPRLYVSLDSLWWQRSDGRAAADLQQMVSQSAKKAEHLDVDLNEVPGYHWWTHQVALF